LLVVVSIIALLISILLPSLKTAREQAKTVVCMATEAGLGRGASTYQADGNGWLAGSPGTSGSLLLGAASGYDGDAVDTPGVRVQTWDWATPLGLFKNYHSSRAERWKMLVNELRCRSNQFLSTPYPPGNHPGWPRSQPMVSYNTLRQFMYWPTTGRGATPPFPGLGFHDPGQIGGDTLLPISYTPRIERVGNPADNVFLSDSSRFTDPVSGILDHDITWNANAGGGWSDGGPTLPDTYLRAFHPSSRRPRLAPLTYRHKRGKDLGVVVTYYDGHAEYMTERQSRWPDPWWPKGTGIPFHDLNGDIHEQVEQYVDNDGLYRVPR
jgi:hypothetical protein